MLVHGGGLSPGWRPTLLARPILDPPGVGLESTRPARTPPPRRVEPPAHCPQSQSLASCAEPAARSCSYYPLKRGGVIYESSLSGRDIGNAKRCGAMRSLRAPLAGGLAAPSGPRGRGRPSCLPACLPACRPACRPACQLACTSVCMSLCQPACLPVCLPVSVHPLVPSSPPLGLHRRPTRRSPGEHAPLLSASRDERRTLFFLPIALVSSLVR